MRISQKFISKEKSNKTGRITIAAYGHMLPEVSWLSGNPRSPFFFPDGFWEIPEARFILRMGFKETIRSLLVILAFNITGSRNLPITVL
ncbi:hypothetical protein [Abyssalbus ytuae]|uniref:Uncharacterized protein n=1 Tax=Abyssalbus ytuae TaxID=2926907 RepID=A0A9E7A428_9FLAO|nr:hypothetical protein [Abyssalbus ytuae]UOB19521.1 hypothetical protein MQE35_01950 [Abyssalbus ytuae]